MFQASEAPIRRLSSEEYKNTVAELFPGVGLPPLNPIPDLRTGGFTNQVDGQAVSELGVETYGDMALAISEAAANDLAAWAPCSADSDACITDIAAHLAFRAYRRPLEADETAALNAFATAARADHGFASATRMVIRALLESPFFLYRPEFGGGAAVGEGATQLSGYEMASRLSYFFLQTMPDQELLDAAASGELDTLAGIKAQAERLIDDPRARPVLTNFFMEWLRLDQLDELGLDPATFPEFSPELVDDLRESVRLFLEQAFWEADSFEALYAGNFGYVNDRLAPIFGVDAPGGSDFVQMSLDPAERAGVLTQPGLLAATSHGITHSPIFRGVMLLSSVLCAPPPAPPEGLLDDIEPLPVPEDELCTTRDHISKTHTNRPACEGCHLSIDGAGFAFENYDALGRFRTEENGCDIDASGAFPFTDLPEGIVGGVELGAALAESDTAAMCMATHLFRFALGRGDNTEDSCEIHALVDALEANGGSLQSVVLSLVETPSFRSRPNPE